MFLALMTVNGLYGWFLMMVLEVVHGDDGNSRYMIIPSHPPVVDGLSSQCESHGYFHVAITVTVTDFGRAWKLRERSDVVS
jgi:hypothetical protein